MVDSKLVNEKATVLVPVTQLWTLQKSESHCLASTDSILPALHHVHNYPKYTHTTYAHMHAYTWTHTHPSCSHTHAHTHTQTHMCKYTLACTHTGACPYTHTGHLPILHQVAQHHNHSTLLVIDHFPEVSDSWLHGTLSYDEGSLLLVALCVWNKWFCVWKILKHQFTCTTLAWI